MHQHHMNDFFKKKTPWFDSLTAFLARANPHGFWLAVPLLLAGTWGERVGLATSAHGYSSLIRGRY